MNPYKAPGSAVQDPPAPPRPPQVTRACRILWAVTLLGAVTLHPWIRGEWWVVPDAEGGDALGLAGAIVITAVFLLVYAGLLLLVGRRHNWGRWALLVYIAAGTFIAAADFPRSVSETPVAAIADVVMLAAELWAFRLLFFGPGAEWFRWRPDA